jgi:hypothetical protein
MHTFVWRGADCTLTLQFQDLSYMYSWQLSYSLLHLHLGLSAERLRTSVLHSSNEYHDLIRFISAYFVTTRSWRSPSIIKLIKPLFRRVRMLAERLINLLFVRLFVRL